MFFVEAILFFSFDEWKMKNNYNCMADIINVIYAHFVILHEQKNAGWKHQDVHK